MTSIGSTISALDRDGYKPLEAITYSGFTPTSTHARPTKFVCDDGRTYWVKSAAQEGIVVELIAGRLGALIGASPVARIVHVPRQSLPLSGEADHLQGIVVGIQDVPESQNARDLQPFIGRREFDPATIDTRFRARVVAFQSWLGVSDQQVLVRFTDGAIFSIDHGACFGSVNPVSDPTIVLTKIPAVADSVGKDPDCVEAAIRQVEQITDQQIAECVSRIPSFDPWKSEAQRRLQIAEWLIHRRRPPRGVMEQWLQT